MSTFTHEDWIEPFIAPLFTVFCVVLLRCLWVFLRRFWLRRRSVRDDMRDALKTALWGALWIAGGLWFWHYCFGNPLRELALIRHAETADGRLVDSFQDEEGQPIDRVVLSEVGIYAYRLPDGREFKTTARVYTGELPAEGQIEYLPDNPSVSRFKGAGCQTVLEWLWRKVGVGIVCLSLFLAPGIELVLKGFREVRTVRAKRMLSIDES